MQHMLATPETYNNVCIRFTTNHSKMSNRLSLRVCVYVHVCYVCVRVCVLE